MGPLNKSHPNITMQPPFTNVLGVQKGKFCRVSRFIVRGFTTMPRHKKGEMIFFPAQFVRYCCFLRVKFVFQSHLTLPFFVGFRLLPSSSCDADNKLQLISNPFSKDEGLNGPNPQIFVCGKDFAHNTICLRCMGFCIPGFYFFPRRRCGCALSPTESTRCCPPARRSSWAAGTRWPRTSPSYAPPATPPTGFPVRELQRWS